MSGRATYVLNRWIDVGETSFVAGALATVAWFVLPSPTITWLLLPPGMLLWLQILCFALLIAVLLTQVRPVLPHSWKSIRNWWSYPPCWFAAIPTIFVAAIVLPFDRSDYIAAALAVSLGCIFSCVASSAGRLRTAPQRPQLQPLAAEESFFKPDGSVDIPVLMGWLDREQAIENAGRDFFGAHAIANRIWKKISASCRVALLGSYGIGKSSVIALTRQLAEQHGGSTVTVDGWGAKPADAAELILRKIVQELGKHVDVLQLASLPSRYRAALIGTRSAPIAVFNELTSHAPMDVLDRLDHVLGALDRRLVVFLEDMDRQAAGETLEAIASLLDRLKRLSHVSFVISIDPARQESIDIIRLCEYSESMLPIDVDTAHRLLDAFFAERVASGDFTNPNKPRMDEWRITQSRDRITRALMGSGRSENVEALLRLMRTPRVMKSVLRQARAAWEELRGEVDLVELVIEECLRVVCPTVWQLICDEVGRFRNLRSGWESDTESARKEREADRKELADMLQRAIEADGVSNPPVQRLILFLFPVWQGEPTRVSETGQLARLSEPTDYWQRMVRQTIAESPTDQSVFLAINSWRESKSSDFPALLYESSFAGETLERFSRLLPKEEILPLAGALHAEMIRRDRSLANLDRTASAISLWRMAITHPLDGFEDFVFSQIALALPKSLMLAIDIGYYWSTERGTEGVPRDQVYDFTRKTAEEVFTDLDALSAALPPLTDNFNPYSFSQLIVAGQLKVDIDEATLAGSWNWLITLLASPAKHEPRVVAQVVGLFSKEVELEHHRRELHFYNDFARILIPEPDLRSRVFRATLAGWRAMTPEDVAPLERFRRIVDEIAKEYEE